MPFVPVEVGKNIRSAADVEKNMTKRNKRQKVGRKRARTRRQMIPQEEISIAGEAEHILWCAMNCESHVVVLGSLVFFSTQTGDAWILDFKDNYALQLMHDMEELDFTINETATNFQIEWQGVYQIEGDLFIFTENSGRPRTIFGYPIKEILQTIQQTSMGS